MSSDAVSEATARLERAVGRLATVLARQPSPAEAAAAGVPPEAVAALSLRLDDTLARLRGALAEIEGAESAALPHDDEPGEDEPGDAAAGRPAADDIKGS
ncbi:hypothetical protein [Roseomonas sp. 18066]|uniref:hypothetical protein n=1 Tax=Roseomonas sp. 18066 TaxID=2681412 RepID=UPI001356EB70|nr:hypothetical protein [Roseomonas sp. 18066]